MDFRAGFVAGSEPAEIEGLFKLILDNLHDGVYFVDLNQRITYWNKAAEQLTGYTAAEVIGKRCADNILIHVNESGCLLCGGACPLSRTIADGRPHEAEIYFHHKNGTRIPTSARSCVITNRDGIPVGAVEIFNDNSRQWAVRERAKELTKLAFLDPASQVANRRYLDRQIKRQLDLLTRQNSPFGIILTDVDNFKGINDNYGHVAGDIALVAVAKTLSGCLRASDVLGRWGGDEFLAILPNLNHDILAATAERCKAMVGNSAVSFEGAEIPVSISVGAVMATRGDTMEVLLHKADQQMYGSKNVERARAVLRPSLNDNVGALTEVVHS